MLSPATHAISDDVSRSSSPFVDSTKINGSHLLDARIMAEAVTPSAAASDRPTRATVLAPRAERAPSSAATRVLREEVRKITGSYLKNNWQRCKNTGFRPWIATTTQKKETSKTFRSAACQAL